MNKLPLSFIILFQALIFAASAGIKGDGHDALGLASPLLAQASACAFQLRRLISDNVFAVIHNLCYLKLLQKNKKVQADALNHYLFFNKPYCKLGLEGGFGHSGGAAIIDRGLQGLFESPIF